MKNYLSMPAILWLALAIACVLLLCMGLRAALKRTGWDSKRQQKILLTAVVIISVWIVLLSVLSLNGFFSDFSKMPPRPALILIITLPAVLVFTFSKTGTAILRATPAYWIVFMQSFRIAVELLLLMAFLKNLLPVQMTFEGLNFDVVTGVLALPTGYWLAKKKANAKKLGIAFNIIGLLLLLNILVIAVLSMPTPVRYFMNEPANTLVAEFPFILLPGVLVPVAYSLHIFSLRQLLTKESIGVIDPVRFETR